MPKLRISPIILLMALICFAFPFVHVSCKMDNPLQGMDKLGKESPKDAKDTKDKKDNVIMTYNGYHLVFGLAPKNRMMKDDPAKGKPEAKPAPVAETSANPGMNDVMQTVAQEPDQTRSAPLEEPAVMDSQNVQDPKDKDAQKGKDAKEEQKATPNPYALFAFILIFAGICLSFVKLRAGYLVVAIISLVASVLLYIMKTLFPAYLLKYMQLDPQAMQYLGLEFTPAYWAAFVLPLLAMIESVLHFAMPYKQEQYSSEQALPFEGFIHHTEDENIEVPAELVDIVEPSDIADDIHIAEELDRVADLDNIKDPEDIPVPVVQPEDEEKQS